MVRAEQRQELRLLEHRASEGPERRLGWKGCFLQREAGRKRKRGVNPVTTEGEERNTAEKGLWWRNGARDNGAYLGRKTKGNGVDGGVSRAKSPYGKTHTP